MIVSSFLEKGLELGDRRVHEGGGDHEADGARPPELLHELRERGRAGGAVFRERVDGLAGAVVHDARVAAALQPAHHVPAHASETDHSELHRSLPW